MMAEGKPTVDHVQKRKTPDLWNHYEVRAFLYYHYTLRMLEIIFDPAVLRAGFSGRLLILIADEAENYWQVKDYLWSNIFRKDERDLVFENLFKSTIKDYVTVTSALWIKEQRDADYFLLGRRLEINKYYDDGVGCNLLVCWNGIIYFDHVICFVRQ